MIICSQVCEVLQWVKIPRNANKVRKKSTKLKGSKCDCKHTVFRGNCLMSLILLSGVCYLLIKDFPCSNWGKKTPWTSHQETNTCTRAKKDRINHGFSNQEQGTCHIDEKEASKFWAGLNHHTNCGGLKFSVLPFKLFLSSVSAQLVLRSMFKLFPDAALRLN